MTIIISKFKLVVMSYKKFIEEFIQIQLQRSCFKTSIPALIAYLAGKSIINYFNIIGSGNKRKPEFNPHSIFP